MQKYVHDSDVCMHLSSLFVVCPKFQQQDCELNYQLVSTSVVFERQLYSKLIGSMLRPAYNTGYLSRCSSKRKQKLDLYLNLACELA